MTRTSQRLRSRPVSRVRDAAWRSAAGVALLLTLGSCDSLAPHSRSPTHPSRPNGPSVEASRRSVREDLDDLLERRFPDELRIVEKQPISGQEDIIIYEARWMRVEDLALTLEPILRERYGPDARIVPHRESRKLLIVLPKRRLEVLPPSSVPTR